MVPFESLGTVSYSRSIVTMAVSVAVCHIFNVKKWPDLENRIRVRSRSLEIAPSCIVCEIWRLIGRKSRNFYTTPVFSAPAGGDLIGIS